MKEQKFQQVRGELTDSIVKDFMENLEKCLREINTEPFLENALSNAEAYFILANRHLDFFDPAQARKMADRYNFMEVGKASPEQIEGLSEKLFIPKENDPRFENQSRLVIASRYFFSRINGIIMNRNYTTRIEPHDAIYLKCVQALYPSFKELSSLNAQTYNLIQETVRKKCRSKAKLKQIRRIETKSGYGIVLQ